jgi:hypothetical protein
MKIARRTLISSLALAAALSAKEPPAVRQEPEATGTAGEQAPKKEHRAEPDAGSREKRPAVRVILPSPYGTSR